ncbi:hypothetical protein TNCV_1631541 [Trichonephila clavipes]|nr:hypothetical protein TNCV_1631541 [Trichonephila clavipes]
MDIIFVFIWETLLWKLTKFSSRCKAVIYYREHKPLSSIDVLEKAGKRSGRPLTSQTAENIEKVSAEVRKNRLQTLTESVGISLASSQWLLKLDLNIHRVCQHIVPRM